jgi:transposase
VNSVIEPIVKCAAGLDVHQGSVTCTVLEEQGAAAPRRETRQYATFPRRLKELGRWLQERGVELAVLESTGIYWKSVYAALEEFGIQTYLVNARHVKQVPGRKTDVADSEWLAELARCGLLKASFVPPRDLRELRLLTRYRRKMSGYLAGEKNRLQKVLEDAGMRLGCVVSDIDGVSAQRMIKALAAGEKDPAKMAALAAGSLRRKQADLVLALEGDLSDRHRFLLQRITNHIRWLEEQLQELDVQIVAAMAPYQEEWRLMQTIPGIDHLSAAMLLAEFGPDMGRFGSKERLSSWAGMCPGNHESAGKKSASAPRRATNISGNSCVKRPTVRQRRTASSRGSSRGSSSDGGPSEP